MLSCVNQGQQYLMHKNIFQIPRPNVNIISGNVIFLVPALKNQEPVLSRAKMVSYNPVLIIASLYESNIQDSSRVSSLPRFGPPLNDAYHLPKCGLK